MPAPTDFSSASFWQSRFAHEEHFEWLDDGTTTLLPPLLDHLEHLESKRAGPELDPWGPGAARVLHIGSGSSDLALRVRTAFERYGMPPDGIMNVDFSPLAVSHGRVREAAHFGTSEMEHASVDLREWRALHDLVFGSSSEEDGNEQEEAGEEESELPGPFDAVLDKSTSDALATGQDVRVPLLPPIPRKTKGARPPMEMSDATNSHSSSRLVCPLLHCHLGVPPQSSYPSRRADIPAQNDLGTAAGTGTGTTDNLSAPLPDPLKLSPDATPTSSAPPSRCASPLLLPALHMHPVELLSYHLAQLVRPGGIWIAMTFASHRFDFLKPDSMDETYAPEEHQMMDSKTKTDPKSKSKSKSKPEKGTRASLGLPSASELWTIDNVIAVDAPTGLEDRVGGDTGGKPSSRAATTVHVPKMQHFVFVLRRTEYTGTRNGSNSNNDGGGRSRRI